MLAPHPLNAGDSRVREEELKLGEHLDAGCGNDWFNITSDVLPMHANTEPGKYSMAVTVSEPKLNYHKDQYLLVRDQGDGGRGLVRLL
ncbi:MAG: hypothetical protein M3302_09570 [Actinomycetota bacterium]|nr:hypothetical protein [Actinomycetota bacterium]